MPEFLLSEIQNQRLGEKKEEIRGMGRGGCKKDVFSGIEKASWHGLVSLAEGGVEERVPGGGRLRL